MRLHREDCIHRFDRHPGQIEFYKGRPEIVITEPAQIENESR